MAVIGVLAVLAAAQWVVDVAMTSPVVYLTVMAAGVVAVGWLTVGRPWKP